MVRRIFLESLTSKFRSRKTVLSWVCKLESIKHFSRFLFGLDKDIYSVGDDAISLRQTKLIFLWLRLRNRLRRRWRRSWTIQSIDLLLFSQPFSFLISSLLGEIVLVPLHFTQIEPYKFIGCNFYPFPPFMSASFRRANKLPASMVVNWKLNDQLLLFSVTMFDCSDWIGLLGFG